MIQKTDKMNSSSLWFSHYAHVWKTAKTWEPDITIKPEITGKKEKWVWDNCRFSATKEKEQIRIVVRSLDHVKITTGKEKKETVPVNFVYQFKISYVPNIVVEEFKASSNDLQKNRRLFGKCRVLRLKREVDGSDCEIWEQITESKSNLEIFHQNLIKIQDRQKNSFDYFIEPEVDSFPAIINPEKKFFPIIYQPAIDTVKNFLRQVHIHQIDGEDNRFEITLVFNNEVLRRWGIINDIYEDFRKIIYGRTQDVETFHIILKNEEPHEFKFEGIHSGNDDISHVSTHGDKKEWWQFWKKLERPIIFYYTNTKYPKIFVNTSNHALGEKDNNPELWKWEYPTSGEKLPIGVGCKSRAQIEKELVPDSKFDRFFKEVKVAFDVKNN